MIVRFPQVIKGQLDKLHSAFHQAISEFKYDASHYGVFPFKVNQRREFIDAIISCGHHINWGLEIGSKPRVCAALSYPANPESLLVCNGFKDREFVELAFIAASLGRKLFLL